MASGQDIHRATAAERTAINAPVQGAAELAVPLIADTGVGDNSDEAH
ncbi:hypothetical protein [uncultured Thiohalocapsa sp.]|nr:hypothetical protein [uncultured Thiohalocapsa sp.]